MKIGFLPLYIALYDEIAPKWHDKMQKFADKIAELYRKRGFDVVAAPICCVHSEFEKAIRKIEKSGAEAILTLHLAYSPSLESADFLAKTKLPIVILDTTQDYEFGYDYGDKIMPNHGIHGVQDMCNLLIRNGKKFLISAGHWEKSDVIDRSVLQLKSAAMFYKMNHLRVGAVGGKFEGMGDFCIPDGTFGMKIVSYKKQPKPADKDVREEMKQDRARFIVHSNLPADVHENTIKASLRIRSWVKKEKLDAFTICFLGISKKDGWETVPFLEASKLHGQGVGYAGEGDVLTAGLTAALFKAFPETSFGEMFCPDWKGNRVFVSHMGEINIALANKTPLLSLMEYNYSDTGFLAKVTACFKGGDACLVNLAPVGDGKFNLVVAPVHFFEPNQASTTANEGWFKSKLGTSAFLEAYSKVGGTHHLAICYRADLDILRGFAELMNFNYCQIG